jgi:hypothetical protein
MRPEIGCLNTTMVSQSGFSDGASFSATVTFTAGYVSALADQRNRADAPQSEKFEECFGLLLEACKKSLEKLPKTTANDTHSALNVTTLIVEGLKILISVRPSLLEKNPETKNFWTEDAQETLEDTLELHEDLAETLALGLSSTFHDEIDSARKEAGIDHPDPDAKPNLPAR